MTTEEKARAYDEAIKVAKNIHRFSSDPAEIKRMEQIFPELKESEDEKIRKAIIKHFRQGTSYTSFCGFSKEQVIAWLEKQGEQKLANTKEYDFHGMKFIPKFAKGYIIKDKKRDEVSTIEDFSYDTGLYTHTYGQFPITIQDNYETIEQKSADKVEPKFKVGDWVVYKDAVWKVCNIALQNYYELLKINNEVSTRLIEKVDKNAHLWTIEDARDGDVLVTDKSVFIYAKVSYNKPYAYCGVDKFGVFKDSCLEHDWANSVDNIHPATKEQRDQLEKAMADAGYTFDFEKKELKKIEQKPAWSKEDEYVLSRIINDLKFLKDTIDLGFTWEDIDIILDITDIIANDDAMEESLKTMSQEEYCKEVLKRFKKQKDESKNLEH